MRSRGGNAFTLTELLVVIGIIAILLSILVPTFGRLREVLRTLVCASNLRQLGIAEAAYTADNHLELTNMRQWLPGPCNHLAANGGDVPSHTWYDPASRMHPGTLWKYFKSDEIVLCPTSAYYAQRDYPQYTAVRSYSINWNIGGDTQGWDSDAVSNTGLVRRPDQLLLFTEENLWTLLDATYHGDFIPRRSSYTLNDPQCIAPDWPNRDTIATYHMAPRDDNPLTPYFGSGNAVFIDSHVELIPWDSQWPGATRPGDCRPIMRQSVNTMP